MEKRHIPKNLRCKGSKKSLGAAAAAFAVCLVLLVFLIGAVIGRYQRQLRSDNSVKAKEFYFTSNLLDGGTYACTRKHRSDIHSGQPCGRTAFF